MYTNADTLTNKMPELKTLVKDIQPSVIAITEVIPKITNIQSRRQK